MENNTVKLPELKECQIQQFNTLMSGKNCYLHGEAGTGKSVVLCHFIEASRKQGKKVVVTAPTGMAADHIDGTTIHRAFGYPIGVVNATGEKKVETIKIGKDNFIEIVKEPLRFKVNEALLEADVVVIDEISSVRMDLFELLTNQIKDINKRRLANIEAGVDDKGPIQLVVAGDFFQTGPVAVKSIKQMKDEPQLLKKLYKTYSAGYAFESNNWYDMNFEYVKLTEVIRTDDKVFSDALKYLRLGNEKILAWFNLKINKKWDEETIVLCGTNDEANEINKMCLDRLPGNERTFEDVLEPEDGYTLDDGDRRADRFLTIKVGARVQSLVNERNNYYSNGSVGTVVKILPDSVYVKFDKCDHVVEIEKYTWNIRNGKDEIIGKIKQIPLRLSYAATVHKVQGQTFDKICIKPDIYFGPAMHYVAVGRCRSLEGLQFYDNKFTNKCTYKNGSQKDIELVSYEVIEFAKKFGLQ